MKAASALLAALLLAQAPAPTLLRRTFKADAIDTYKIEDKVSQTVKSAMGTLPMTIATSRTYAVRTTSVDAAAGTARFSATTTVDKIEASGPAAAAVPEKPQPFTQAGKIDVRGRMTLDPSSASDTLTSVLNGAQGVVASGVFAEFPEKAVKIGDSWDVVVPKSPLLFDQDQRLTATLTGEREENGVPVWTVTIKGTLKTFVDGTKLPNAPGASGGNLAMRLKGQDELTGEGTVEKATGRILTMTTKSASKRTIELLDTGLTIDADGTTESTATLQK